MIINQYLRFYKASCFTAEFSNFQFGAVVFNPNVSEPAPLATHAPVNAEELNANFEIRLNTRCRNHMAAESEMTQMPEGVCAAKCQAAPKCQVRSLLSKYSLASPTINCDRCRLTRSSTTAAATRAGAGYMTTHAHAGPALHDGAPA